MHNHRLPVLVPLAAALLCGLFGGCKEAKEVAKSLAEGRARGPMHQRLKWKAEEFFTDPGVISLCEAIEARDLAKIDQFVKSGVDVNAKGRGNMTPLLWAFPMGEDVFKRMLELGADPNVKLTENTLILSKGKSVVFASVELADGLIHSQLFHDVAMDNYLKLVLEHGGDANQEDTETGGETPIFSAVIFQPNAARKISLLASFGADINHQDQHGHTAVFGAACACHQDSALVLLRAGSDYRIPGRDGWDLILRIERERMERDQRGRDAYDAWKESNQKPLCDWLTGEGVNWAAARAALASPQTMRDIKNLPADYKHRPWFPQRPTLKKPDGVGPENGTTSK